MKILVVDDEPVMGRAIARVLGRDRDVQVVEDAGEVVRRVAAGERWDVILCDLMMPGMTGMDLAAHLEATAPELAGRMIFMTGGAFTGEAAEFLARPGRRVLEKPIDAARLRDMVAR